MSFCPFMSGASGMGANMDKLYPCIDSCELYVHRQCSLKLLAKSQYEISKIMNEEYDR